MATRPFASCFAEDEELIRTALVALLEREPDITVIATASDGRDALDKALGHRPDVAVVDLLMPGRDGITVVTELARLLPRCAGIILTGHARPHLLRQALSSGARGFLAKVLRGRLWQTWYAGSTGARDTWTRSSLPTR